VVRGRDAVGSGANCLNLQGHGGVRRQRGLEGWSPAGGEGHVVRRSGLAGKTFRANKKWALAHSSFPPHSRCEHG
jgi:hypothetical protein